MMKALRISGKASAWFGGSFPPVGGCRYGRGSLKRARRRCLAKTAAIPLPNSSIVEGSGIGAGSPASSANAGVT